MCIDKVGECETCPYIPMKSQIEYMLHIKNYSPDEGFQFLLAESEKMHNMKVDLEADNFIMTEHLTQ